jgi:hypothetical protein
VNAIQLNVSFVSSTFNALQMLTGATNCNTSPTNGQPWASALHCRWLAIGQGSVGMYVCVWHAGSCDTTKQQTRPTGYVESGALDSSVSVHVHLMTLTTPHIRPAEGARGLGCCVTPGKPSTSQQSQLLGGCYSRHSRQKVSTEAMRPVDLRTKHATNHDLMQLYDTMVQWLRVLDQS